jgi:hypothetical protein
VPDRLALQFTGRRHNASPPPPGLRHWNGYSLPDTVRTHHREALISIAGANGLSLSPALLHKWAYWRLIPTPTPGGPTGKGRGKGQRWTHTAAWRVAWISRWLSGTLTYDGLRLAIWPWTPSLEQERAPMIINSVRRFLIQDRDFHDRALAEIETEVLGELDPYIGLMEGDHRDAVVARALDIAGVGAANPSRAQHEVFFRHLGFTDLTATAASLVESDIAEFITAWRASTADQIDRVTTIFWTSPIGLARILIRELHRYRLIREGTI